MDNKKQELLGAILRDSTDNTRKFEETLRELKSHPLWQEMQNWVVIDWNDDPEKLTQNGVTVTKLLSREEWCLANQNHCFVRNFPSLRVESAHLTDCIFDNCGDLTIEQGIAVNCIFSRVNTLGLENAKVYDSVFQDLHCDCGGMIIAMEDSTISGCKFKDIRLEDDNYLGDGVGDCLIEKCSFERISTEREDGELFTCQDTVGTVFKKEIKYNMVDQLSCTGLNRISAENKVK